MQGFPGIFCYILGVKVTDLVSLNHTVVFILLVMKISFEPTGTRSDVAY